MLVSKQLTDALLDNARIIRKESLEISHKCRNTMYLSNIETCCIGRKNIPCESLPGQYANSGETDDSILIFSNLCPSRERKVV